MNKVKKTTLWDRLKAAAIEALRLEVLKEV